jgi:hypothetical protein
VHLEQRSPRRGVASLAAVVAVLLVTVVPPPAAQAHPFGDPQTVEISADGEVVRIQWRFGGADDLTLLAISLGLLPRSRVMLDGAVFPEESDVPTLAGADAFRDYLLDRIRVNGCQGTVESTDDLADTGAVIAFACGAPVESAEVTVRMLTDLHPAYQTMAVGPHGQRSVYDAEQEVHDWTLGAAPEEAAAHLGRSAAVQMSATVGAVLAATAAGLLWVRRQRRRLPR